jgi:hypothetical protein
MRVRTRRGSITPNSKGIAISPKRTSERGRKGGKVHLNNADTQYNSRLARTLRVSQLVWVHVHESKLD